MSIYESQDDKINKCVQPAMTDQPKHQPSLTRGFAVCMKKALVRIYEVH